MPPLPVVWWAGSAWCLAWAVFQKTGCRRRRAFRKLPPNKLPLSATKQETTLVSIVENINILNRFPMRNLLHINSYDIGKIWFGDQRISWKVKRDMLSSAYINNWPSNPIRNKGKRTPINTTNISMHTLNADYLLPRRKCWYSRKVSQITTPSNTVMNKSNSEWVKLYLYIW